MSDWLYALARVLLPLLFVVEGVGKFANMSVFADMLQRSSLPQYVPLEFLGPSRFLVLGYLVAAVEVVGGLMIMLGYRTRLAAIGLVLFTIAAILIAHPFWLLEGRVRAIELTNALKNLSIIAGLLFLVAAGPGPFSLDGRRRRY